MSSRVGKLILALIGCMLIVPVGKAQDANTAILSTPQTDAFPQVTAFLDVRNEQGNFISGLQTHEVTVLENERRLPVDALQEQRPGVQFVVAINPGNPFAIRDSQGNSRYDFLAKALQDWAISRRHSPEDDLSLITTTGVQETHLADPADWLAALNAYQPDLRAAVPDLEILSQAISLAADPSPRSGMGRAVLFITPYPETNVAAALGSLAARASQAGIRIHVWMVASTNLFDSVGAVNLAELATSTGGSFLAFSGIEPLPDIETYLEPVRRIYLLTYSSQARASGPQQLSVEVRSETFTANSLPQNFELQISPPNPVFVSPPAQILRSDPTQERGEDAALLPREQELEILIEFPDGHSRPLQRTTLYVDGEILAENTSPPFERFQWDLSGYLSSGRHLLQVEAVDVLGLSGLSTETPIQITLQRPPQTILTAISRNAPALTAAAVLMAGAILLLVLILGGRIRPRPLYMPRLPRRRKEDPVTQPVPSHGAAPTVPTRRLGRLAPHLPWPKTKAETQPLAFLAQFSGDDPSTTATPIPITAREITLGSDPKLATVVLEDPSVDGLHARIQIGPDGAFMLSDQGSIAGTWINYAPITKEWVEVEDGDLIHVGRVGFRFTCRNPSQPRKATVVFEEPGK